MRVILRTRSVILRRGRTAVLALSMLAFAACNSGSSSSGGGNTAPTANAGIDQNVSEMSTVQLNGTGSDADGNALTYSWTQTVGATVTIANGDTATASFTAPDVVAGSPETLTFQLRVSDGTVSATDTVNVTVAEPQPQVMVSGTVNYEWVPPRNNCRGLDFNATFSRPIRGAPVQLLDSGDNVLGTTVAGDDGSYVFNNIAANTMVHLRVRAELKQPGSPGWDVEVRDNTSVITKPLDSRPLYVVDGAPFDTGSIDVTEIFLAEAGWGGSSYTSARAAAPFAILDTMYTAIQFVVNADATASFPSLDVFWSINNTADTTISNIDTGELGTSFYRGGSGIRQLFLLGDAADDTEEFDDHVVLHEWGHYFEDVFSRSDSFGGPHTIGESLEARLSFGEGWGSAFAGIALGDPIYCDTGAAGTNEGFPLDAESGSYGVQGWFNEWSVTTYIYDLWDTDNDGFGATADNGSIGWGPIYNIMTGPQASTEAFTTLFSFATELRSSLGAQGQALVDSQLDRRNVVFGNDLDIWASNETNDAGVTQDVLPLYTDYTAGDPAFNICVNNQLDGLNRDGNNVGEDRYLRIAVPTRGQYNVRMAATTPTPVTLDPDDRDQSDPDIYLFEGPNFVGAGTSGADNVETFTTQTLQAGTTYIAFLEEWRYEDDAAPTDYPERMCFDVSFTLN